MFLLSVCNCEWKQIKTLRLPNTWSYTVYPLVVVTYNKYGKFAFTYETDTVNHWSIWPWILPLYSKVSDDCDWNSAVWTRGICPLATTKALTQV